MRTFAPSAAACISIHALREEGDHIAVAGRHTKHISIHALREEGDGNSQTQPHLLDYFYPRPPRGGRHFPLVISGKSPSISIHALREEGDVLASFSLALPTYFYPRPPRGGRPILNMKSAVFKKFLSTPSARRATTGDAPVTLGSLVFLSTPSARRATGFIKKPWADVVISIHALREEGDRGLRQVVGQDFYFYPRPPRGGRPSTPRIPRTTRNFYPRPPRGGRRH